MIAILAKSGKPYMVQIGICGGEVGYGAALVSKAGATVYLEDYDDHEGATVWDFITAAYEAKKARQGGEA